ncbi:extracellular solute-binding protein [Acidisphaera sp. L21]|uniref:extracellular solute-binding protein n=1 Tax=Acidisphaera sp. L21 TaxID=1641851 RepID=UPI00131BCBBB|nr:extracellular solute-binding protein [Acidisphaera sp. L21]
MIRRATPLLAAAAMLLTPGLASAADVNVMYAGSLVNLMEHGVGPAFDKASGETFKGFGGGSNGLANQIKGKLRRADVFISANPKVNDMLTGGANGDWVNWYVTFAQSPLVIGYSPTSKFAAELKTKPWYEVLREPGIKIGRTDAKLDPKGALTVQLMDKAEQVYHQPGLAKAVLGTPDNPDQVRPEENLVGRLQSGQIDIGFFYSTETSDLKIPAIPLPPEVALSAVYTVTILRDAADPAGAAKFVDYLLSAPGKAVMQEHGLDVVAPTVTGDATKIPAAIHLK